MQAEQVYRILQTKPFQPVRVHLMDGQTYDIPLRELVVVGVDYLDIGIQAPDYPPGIMSHFVTVQLTEIERLEPLASAATRASA
jgi:hypothetical protein